MKLGEVSERKRRETGEINVAPLIDMVFILLIFFMVTTTFATDVKLDVQRPDAQSAQEVSQDTLRVALDDSGRITVDGRSINPWMLQSRVRAALNERTTASVLVVADTRIETGDLVHLVDECKLAGARDVGVAVRSQR